MADRPLPVSLRPQLAFLIRLLASPHEGERLGAVAALGRKLRAVGLDFNDLGDYVERTGATPSRLVDPSPPPSPPPARPRSRRAQTWKPPVHVALSHEDRAALLKTIVEAIADPQLKGWGRWELLQLFDRLERGELPPTRRMIERAEGIIAGLERATA